MSDRKPSNTSASRADTIKCWDETWQAVIATQNYGFGKSKVVENDEDVVEDEEKYH